MDEIFSLDALYLSDRQSTFIIQVVGKKTRLGLRPRDRLIINRALPYKVGGTALLVINNKFSLGEVTAEFLEKNNPDSGDFIWGMVQTMMRELE